MAKGDTRKVLLQNKDEENLIPYTELATASSAGRVKPDGTTTSVDSNGTITVIGKQDTISSSNPLSADLVTSGTTNKVVTQTEKDTWNAKQAALTFDTAPVSLSTNPVTSGGIYNAIQNTGSSLDYTGTTLSLENAQGTVLSSVTIKSTPDLDNTSITLNGSSQLQTVGVINSRDSSTAVKTWTGTKAQYDALKATHIVYEWKDSTLADALLVYTDALRPNDDDPVYDSSYNIIGRVVRLDELNGNTYIFVDSTIYDSINYFRPTADDSATTIYENRIDPNTLYNITDDTDGGSSVYTKTEVDTLLNTKANVSLDNLVINVAQYTDLGTHTVAKNGTVTFPQDITQFDYLIALSVTKEQNFKGGTFLSGTRVKMISFWVGVDSLNGTPYAQSYSIDMEKTNDNTYTVWSCGWMNLLATSGELNEVTRELHFYGINVI